MGCLQLIMRRGRLSEIDIDVDKVWRDGLGNSKGITNIKEVTASMVIGNLAQHNGAILERIVNGPDTYVLTSRGLGKLLTWMPTAGALKYYFPVLIELTDSEVVVPVDKSYNKIAPFTREYKYAYLDAPADMITRLTPAIVSADTEVVVPVDRSHNVNVPVGRDISILVEGAVSETNAGAQTDETAVARSAALNDMHLNPMTPIAGDKYYIGASWPFPRMWFYLSTQGTGNWTNQWFYWDGGAWQACVAEIDYTSSFQATAGIKRIQHTPQAGWALRVIQGMNLYWLKCETTAFVNQITAPLGAQVNCCLVT